MRRHLVLALGLFLLLAGSTLAVAPASFAAEPDDPDVTLVFFYGDGCPYCAAEEEFLVDLVARYPRLRVEAHEVWHNEAAARHYLEVAAAHGIEPQGVPGTFLAGRAWIGFSSLIGQQIEQALIEELARLDQLVPTPLPTASPATSPTPEPSVSPEPAVVDVPFVGPIDLAGQSLVVTTALIGFVDGFNPCSLWVLSVLLAMMLHSGSRSRMLAVGVTFLAVCALAYGLFMIGLVNVIGLIGLLGWVQVVVALVVLVLALISIKDYFWFGRGVSLVIPARHKPMIYQRSRALLSPERSLLGVLAATAVLAAAVSYLELPCTAGLPLLWSGLVSQAGVSVVEFGLLLGLYLAIFMLDEGLLLGVALVTMRVGRVQEHHGRVLKLVGGSVMLALALTMLLAPEVLQTLIGAVVVFGLAVLAAGLIVLAHRLILPRLGIRLGSA